MKVFSTVSAAALGLALSSGAAQAAVRTVTGQALFGGPPLVSGPYGPTFVDALGLDQRLTTVDFSFTFDDAKSFYFGSDQYGFKVISTDVRVNGVTAASGVPEVGTSHLTMRNDSGTDAYSFSIGSFPELTPEVPGYQRFQFAFDLALAPGAVNPGAVPLAGDLAGQILSVQTSAFLATGTPHPDGVASFAQLAGGQVTLTEAAVPEPSAWALMLAGFGLTGGAIRMQRRRIRLRIAA